MTKDQPVYDKARNILIRIHKLNGSTPTPKSKIIRLVRDILGDKVSGEPVQILTLFCQMHPVVEPRQSVIDNARTYTLDRAMTRAMLRCKDMPTQIGIN